MDKRLLQYAIENVVSRHVTSALWDVYERSRKLLFGFYLMNPRTNTMIMNRVRGKARAQRSLWDDAVLLAAGVDNGLFEKCCVCKGRLGAYQVKHRPGWGGTDIVCEKHLQEYVNRYAHCAVTRLIRTEGDE